MTMPAESFASEIPSSNGAPFRVQDNARALWLVMAVLLISGFAVLRVLTGASDAPQVDTATHLDGVQEPPPLETLDDDIHRLRPQTSATLPQVEPIVDVLETSELTVTGDDGWNHLPAASWQSVPNQQNAETTVNTSELAHEPELLR
jgi:hypothetical protein